MVKKQQEMLNFTINDMQINKITIFYLSSWQLYKKFIASSIAKIAGTGDFYTWLWMCKLLQTPEIQFHRTY